MRKKKENFEREKKSVLKKREPVAKTTEKKKKLEKLVQKAKRKGSVQKMTEGLKRSKGKPGKGTRGPGRTKKDAIG